MRSLVGVCSVFSLYGKFFKRSALLLVLLVGVLGCGYALKDSYGQLRKEYDRLVTDGALKQISGTPIDPMEYIDQNIIALNFQKSLNNGEAKFLYFNDSVMGGHNDHEPRTTIAEMVADRLQVKITPVNRAGYTAVLYREYAAMASLAKDKPLLAIISINLRTFCDQCFFESKWEYAGNNYYLHLLSHPPRLIDVIRSAVSGRGGDERYWDQYLDEMKTDRYKELFIKFKSQQEDFFEGIGSGLDEEDRARGRHFVENYIFDIDLQHPMLQSLLQTATQFKSSGTKVVFYITPIDVQGGKSLVGPDFEPIIKKNVKVIKEALAEIGVDCLDMSSDLPTDRFVDREYACEHLDFAGRAHVASRLGDWLRATDKTFQQASR
uniref:Uncharacterized protein n=1 Tax=Desulfovibrio sp. U5L TaxID=596152 RepID=I2Q731_9BACT